MEFHAFGGNLRNAERYLEAAVIFAEPLNECALYTRARKMFTSHVARPVGWGCSAEGSPPLTLNGESVYRPDRGRGGRA